MPVGGVVNDGLKVNWKPDDDAIFKVYGIRERYIQGYGLGGVTFQM